MVVFVSCDDYDYDEENYVPLHLETTLKDNWHTTIGYAYTGGVVKDKHYDMIGNVFSDGKVLDLKSATIIQYTIKGRFMSR